MAPQRTLDGLTAIVTGASRGIGETLAFDLASRGAKVVITFTSDKSRDAVEKLKTRISSEANSSAIVVQCDLSDPSSPAKIIDETIAAFQHIDIIVNNAGMMLAKPIQDITLADFDAIFHLNVRAPMLLIQAALPHLRRPGRIINLSSVGARAHFPGVSAYQASKAALEGFTRGWAADLGGDGTTVNCVAPGPVESDMLDLVPESIVGPQKTETPVQKRVGTSQEIAEIVAFLAEGRSSWVSGQTISASGGYATY